MTNPRPIFFALAYLALAVIFEVAILPQFNMLTSGPLSFLFQWRMLAMAGILAGMLRGELAGLVMALGAALLFGFSQPIGALGAALVSFPVVAYVAGKLARFFRFRYFATRWMWIVALLLVERLVWLLVRVMFWPGAVIEIPWRAAMLTAVIGALCYTVAARWIKIDMTEMD